MTGREPLLEDHPDSLVALADWLGVEPCCGAPLGDCRCDPPEPVENL